MVLLFREKNVEQLILGEYRAAFVAETHHFFARGAGVDRYFVAPGKGQQSLYKENVLFRRYVRSSSHP